MTKMDMNVRLFQWERDIEIIELMQQKLIETICRINNETNEKLKFYFVCHCKYEEIGNNVLNKWNHIRNIKQIWKFKACTSYNIQYLLLLLEYINNAIIFEHVQISWEQTSYKKSEIGLCVFFFQSSYLVACNCISMEYIGQCQQKC